MKTLTPTADVFLNILIESQRSVFFVEIMRQVGTYSEERFQKEMLILPVCFPPNCLEIFLLEHFFFNNSKIEKTYIIRNLRIFLNEPIQGESLTCTYISIADFYDQNNHFFYHHFLQFD